MKAWQQLPGSVKLIAIVGVLLCLIDFSQRVYIDNSVDARAFDANAGAQNEFQTARISDEVEAWLERRREIAEQRKQEQDQATVSEPQVALLEGGVNLGNMRVRVRGIYTSAQNEQRIALIDTQELENRSVEITEVTEGFELNGYTVSKINVNSVTFIGGEDESVTIPVFDY
ncbi:hypothetical protein ACQ5ES_05585 [Pseudidiomarina sp. E22-M8]|uniref:hypothetical protein n=1 Tax=Pseudidiomarina sp. E22-M8 TaxID=3424768 RepID=UPI00403D06D0